MKPKIALERCLIWMLIWFLTSCGSGGGSVAETVPAVNPPADISSNTAPVLEPIGNKVVTEGETLSFRVSASDAETGTLTFRAENMPAGASFDSQMFVWAPSLGDAGKYEIRFDVTDGDSTPLSASETVVIWVTRYPLEYGETGPYSISIESFANSMWGDWPVTVLLPAERSGPVPVMFFSHGLYGMDWNGYASILTHLVSWGSAVVFSPYPATAVTIGDRYRILWNGFKEAAERYAAVFDFRRVGFLGHSMGGGATPAMAWRGLVEQGWGKKGAFLFIMAPWYSYEISDDQLGSFPENLNMIMQVYDYDDVCDHRMAIDIFSNISVPFSSKAYYNVHNASHYVPADFQINDLDRLAVWQPMDALIDYTFKIYRPNEGGNYALEGEGEHFQHDVTKNPVPVADEPAYVSPWSFPGNPRL